MRDIIETMKSLGKFSKLLRLIELTGHVDTLKKCHTFTMFAPVDEAMEELELEYPIEKEYRKYFLDFIKRHVIRGKVAYNGLIKEKARKTRNTLINRGMLVMFSEKKRGAKITAFL